MFRPDGSVLGFGGSGRNEGFNNVAMQDRPFVGPLPSGEYAMRPAITHPRLGPVAIELLPDPANIMHGRQGFWIHGWSGELGIRKSSDGCILLSRGNREDIDASEDKALTVV